MIPYYITLRDESQSATTIFLKVFHFFKKSALRRDWIPFLTASPSLQRKSTYGTHDAKPPPYRIKYCSPIVRGNSIVYCGRFMNRPYDDRVIFCRGHSRMTRGESCGQRCHSCSPIDCGNLFGFLDRRGRRSLRVLHEFYCSLTRPLFQKNGQ